MKTVRVRWANFAGSPMETYYVYGGVHARETVLELVDVDDNRGGRTNMVIPLTSIQLYEYK